MDINIELHVEREEANSLLYEKLTPLTNIEVQLKDGLQPANFADPVSVIVTVAVSVIAERLVDSWLRSKQRGVMIDLRCDKPIISRVSGVPEGTLMVINKNNTKDIKQFDYKHRSTFIKTITSILGHKN
jgi:hypothetical protein